MKKIIIIVVSVFMSFQSFAMVAEEGNLIVPAGSYKVLSNGDVSFFGDDVQEDTEERIITAGNVPCNPAKQVCEGTNEEIRRSKKRKRKCWDCRK